MANPKIQVAVPAELADWVQARHELRNDAAPLSGQCISDLWTLRAIMAEELRRQSWSLDELAEIAGALSGVMPDAGVPQGIGAAYAAVYDEHRDRQVHPSDAETVRPLLDRLGALGPAGDMALCEAVAAWWRDGDPHSAEGWAAHGIRVVG